MIPKITPKEYERRRQQLIERFMPRIYRCNECGSPVVKGYICSFCQHDNSDDDDAREE